MAYGSPQIVRELVDPAQLEDLSGHEELQDPLLDCLERLARHFDRAISKEALVAGLPLVQGRLTPGLFPRAAERAGLSARVVKRRLTQLSSLLLPAVLILEDNRALLLLKKLKAGLQVSLPEVDGGTETIPLADLKQLYTGYAILVKPVFQRSESAPPSTLKNPRRWFWGTVAGLWPVYVQVVIAAALVNSLALAAPLFIMNVYDRVLPNKAFSTLWVLAFGMLLAIAMDFILRTVRNRFLSNAGRRADVLIAGQILEHVLNLDLSHRPAQTGAFASKLRDYELVREFFTSSTIITITDFLFIGLFVFIVQQIAGMVALVPALAAAIVILIGLILQFPLKRAVTRAQSEASHRHSMLFEALSGLETIKSMRAEGQVQRDWEQFVGENSRTANRLRAISMTGLNLTTFVQQAATVCIIVLGVYLFDQGDISAGALIAAVIISSRALAPLGQIVATLSRSQQAFHALRALNEVMVLPVEGQEQRRFVDKTIDTGRVEFNDVTFHYPGSEEPALKEFNLKISAGERIGIIGKVGSGKTTVGRVMSRLYVPTTGHVLLDGVDMRHYHPSEVRRQVCYVSQDSVLFDGTVRDNIVFGARHVADDMVLRAAEITGVSDFVNAHPLGLNMPVGEAGRFLSSGQRQAVTLARAFLFEPAIIFLDEPTGSMDMTAEAALIKRLKTALGPKQTLVLTTHRSTVLSVVDRLIVIDRRRVAADGPKDRVLKKLAEH